MADAAAAEEAQSPPVRGGGNKLLIAILFAILLSGGVGAGVYFSMHHSAEAPADEGEEVDAADEGASAADEEEAKPKKGKGKKGKKGKKAAPKAPAVFVPFDPPFVANFESEGELRFLQVQVEVMTRDPIVAEQIKTQTPVIRNELLLLFGSVDATKITTREGKEKVRQDALDSIRRIVTDEGGKGEKIESVYFTSFVMQ